MEIEKGVKMNINLNNSPSFTSTHVFDSKMTQAARKLSTRIIDDLVYSNEYEKAHLNELDVYFLPHKKANKVNVVLLDKYSDNFVKQSGNKRLAVTADESDNKFDIVDKIKNNIMAVLSGKVKRPEQNIEKIAEGKTDMQRLRPELQDDIAEFTEKYLDMGYDKKSAKQAAANDYINLNIRFNEDYDF